MIRIAENILTGGDIGNVQPTMPSSAIEIREQQYDPIVGRFYRVKGDYARTSGSQSFQPIGVGAAISFGILVKGAQPHTIRADLDNGTAGGVILLKDDIEITTDWQWIFTEGATSIEVQDGDKVRVVVYPRNFELHWAKAAAYIGPPSDIWTPAHADLTPEQIATLPPYGEYKEIKSF